MEIVWVSDQPDGVARIAVRTHNASTMTNGTNSPAQELRKAILTGKPVKRGNGEPAEHGYQWGNDRIVSASELYQVLTLAQGDAEPRAAVLEGLRITDRLNLQAAELKVPLICHRCYFDRPVNLMNATATEIRLTCCCSPGLAASQLVTRGDLDLSKSHLGIVILHGARVSGNLLLSRTILSGGNYPLDLGDGCLHRSRRSHNALTTASLVADGLAVDEDMFCDDGFSAWSGVQLSGAHIAGGLTFNDAKLSQDLTADRLTVDGNLSCKGDFKAGGKVSLPGAHVGGQLVFNGATLGHGLTADGLTVDGDMFCKNFKASGELRLPGAHVSGQLVFNGATLGHGLTADGLTVDGDMFCDEGFRALGELRLPGAHIGGQLSFDGAKPIDAETLELNLRGLRVTEELFLSTTERFAGKIDLANARVGELVDCEHTWPRKLQLSGLVYGAIKDQGQAKLQQEKEQPAVTQKRRLRRELAEVEQRLRWIRLAEERSSDDPADSDGYMPQPYTQLMTFCREEGRDRDARRAAYERERRRWPQLGITSKAWNSFLRWTVGYGYRPLRALLWLMALLLVGACVFSSLHTSHKIVPLKATHQPFDAMIFTLDRLIPVVSFGLREAYAPEKAAQWWAFSYTLVGWMLSIAVIAGLNSAVRREN
jgi:hypothetical protein